MPIPAAPDPERLGPTRSAAAVGAAAGRVRWRPHRLGGLFLLAVALLPLVACGGGQGDPLQVVGTVALRNETDVGMAPQVVTQFFLTPTAGGPTTNLLTQDVDPGAVVILGLFPVGTYDAVAVLASGGSVVFLDREIRADQPTTFVVPGS
ncbi:MAG: hypothetical protein O2894_02295 [Planctomycetota bacterium]|nr:hypothetical protein [Planctomycetota bacterium]